MNKKPQIVWPTFLSIFFLMFVFPIIAMGQATSLKTYKSFRDDFSMQSIKPEWRIVDKDTDRYSLIDNQYLMLVTKKPAVNRFIFDTTDLPDNFLAEIKIDDVPIQVGQGFSLLLVKDKDNYLELSMSVSKKYGSHGRPVWNITFMKKLKGEETQYGPITIRESTKNSKEKIITKDNSLKLAIRKNEVEYTGAYSIGNDLWQELGAHLFINLKGFLNFMAFNWQDNVPESPVKVDYFEFKELE